MRDDNTSNQTGNQTDSDPTRYVELAQALLAAIEGERASWPASGHRVTPRAIAQGSAQYTITLADSITAEQAHPDPSAYMVEYLRDYQRRSLARGLEMFFGLAADYPLSHPASSRVTTLYLTRTSAVGFYYDDQHGVGWATSTGPERACEACGKRAHSGYDSGAATEEGRFTCGCNVVVIDNEPKEYPGMMLPPGSERPTQPVLRFWNVSNVFEARDRYVRAHNGALVRVRLFEGGWKVAGYEGLDIWTACRVLNDMQATLVSLPPESPSGE